LNKTRKITIVLLSMILLLTVTPHDLCKSESLDMSLTSIKGSNQNNRLATFGDGPYINDAWSRTIRNVATTSELRNSWAGAESSYSACLGNALMCLADGSILCEIGAHYQGTGDYSVCDKYLAWSYDNGNTWSNPEPFLDGHRFYGDDIKIYSQFGMDRNNRLWCIVSVDLINLWKSHNYAIYSDDNGHTWVGVDSATKFINSNAIDITSNARLNELTNPRNGFFSNGIATNNGRLIFVGWMNGHGKSTNLFSIWTDNPESGRSSKWYHSAEFGLDTEYSESSIVLLENDKLYATIRDNAKEGGTPRRFSSLCQNPGTGTMQWSEPKSTMLLDPESMAQIRRITNSQTSDKSRIVLCWNNHTSSRVNLTLAVSYDECNKWKYSRIVSDYSYPQMCVTENKTVLISYIKSWSQTSLDLFQCNLEWITRGWDQISGELTANAGGPYSGQPNMQVQFVGSAYGGTSPYSYHWDFGDGATAETQNPKHSYTAEGTFNAVLTVRDGNRDTSKDTTTVRISTNNAPTKPEKPTGTTLGRPNVEYTYVTIASDADGDQIKYGWDWDGDKLVDEWTEFFDSDKSIKFSHSWNGQGTYEVRVKARDVYGTDSDWSETLAVSIPRFRGYNENNFSSILEKIIEFFSLLERLFNIGTID